MPSLACGCCGFSSGVRPMMKPSGVIIMLLKMFLVARGLIYASSFALLWYWLALAVRRYDPALPLAIPDWLRPIGLAIAIIGGLVAAICITVFITRGKGTPAPFDAPEVFVATGPYRFVRNPMYLGAMGIMAGFGLMLRSPAILLLALAFFFIAHIFVVAYEEPALTARFGASYLNYKTSVQRWLPRTGPSNIMPGVAL